MEEITEMIAVWMDTKKTVVVVIREGKRLQERLQLMEEEMEQEVEMRRKTHTQQAISGEEESLIAKSVAEFRRKKLNVTRTAETTQASTIKIETNSIEPNSNSTNSNESIEDPSNSNYNTIIAEPNSITTPPESNTKKKPTQCRSSSVPSRTIE